MQRIISQVHHGLVLIFLAGLLLQFYLTGTALFGVGSFVPHRMLGAALAILAILSPVLALVGRLGRKQIGLSLLLAFLTIVQIMLPALRGSAAWIAALHSLNALALLGISVRMRRSGRPEASAGEPSGI